MGQKSDRAKELLNYYLRAADQGDMDHVNGDAAEIGAIIDNTIAAAVDEVMTRLHDVIDYPRIEKPTRTGAYFYRPMGDRGAWVVLEVSMANQSAAWPGRERVYHIEDLDGAWRGPIPRPPT